MPKRSLMLAGGGLKIAFQAGVMQVWLDEAGIEFDHGDGVSAACFNLAMWTQGMSGRQIADNWRNLFVDRPGVGVDGDSVVSANASGTARPTLPAVPCGLMLAAIDGAIRASDSPMASQTDSSRRRVPGCSTRCVTAA